MAILLAVGVIEASRADGHARLTSDEMNYSRGGDQGAGIAVVACNLSAGQNAKKACPQKNQMDDGTPVNGIACTKCKSGTFKSMIAEDGGFFPGQGGKACGKSGGGVCIVHKHNTSMKVIAVNCVTAPGKKLAGVGCIPGPGDPIAQPINPGGGPGPGY